MELPLGIFTIAIVTVFFPAMARAYGDDAERSFESVFYKGFRLMILIVVPASLGLILLSKAYFNYTLSMGFFCAIGCFADCSDSNYFCIIASFFIRWLPILLVLFMLKRT